MSSSLILTRRSHGRFPGQILIFCCPGKTAHGNRFGAFEGYAAESRICSSATSVGTSIGAWSVCRQLAPASDDPEFAVNLFNQLLTFHRLYFRVRILSAVSFYWHEDFEFGAIVEVLGMMRQSAAQMVRLSQISAAHPLTRQ